MRLPSSLRYFLPNWHSGLTGILWGFSTAHWNYDWLILFALVPLLFETKAAKSHSILLVQGAWSITIGGIITLFWVPPALLAHAPQLGVVGSWALFLVFNLFAHPQIYVMNALVRVAREKRRWNSLTVAAIAVVFALCDLFYPKLLNDTLAHSLFRRYEFLTYFAYPRGTYVLTFLLAWLNLEIFFRLEKQQHRTAAALGAGAWLLIVTLPPLPLKQHKEKRLEVISFNTFIHRELGPRGDAARLEIFKALKRNIEDLPDASHERIVVFPESTYPFLLLDEKRRPIQDMNRDFVETIMRKKIHVFIGNVKLKGEGQLNVLVHIRPSGEIKYVAKRVLFPFGERIPLGEYLTVLDRVIPKSGMLVPAEIDEKFFMVSGRKIIPSICYESLFPALVREIGPGIVLNVSNEMLFPRAGEPILSFAQSVFTSLENRVPLVRTSNSGMGGYIDRGKIVDVVEPTTTVVRRYWIE